jgi:hypothetical protein
MIGEPRHKFYANTISEHILEVASELPIDAVGMWQIVPGARRGFDLEGDALTDYVRRCVTELLSRGAVPVFGGGPDGPHDWIVQRQYGSRPEEIIENVIREWLANGAQDEDPGGLWFALPQYAWTPPS